MYEGRSAFPGILTSFLTILPPSRGHPETQPHLWGLQPSPLAMNPTENWLCCPLLPARPHSLFAAHLPIIWQLQSQLLIFLMGKDDFYYVHFPSVVV